MDKSQIDKVLYEYYDDLKKLEMLEYQVKQFEKENSRILDSFKKINITLTDGVGAIDYSRDKVDGGTLESPYDRQIEVIVGRMENNLEHNNLKIFDLNHKIVQIKNRNISLDTVIKNIDIEDKQILEQRYKCKCSQDKIAKNLNLSRGYIRKKLDAVIILISGYVDICV